MAWGGCRLFNVVAIRQRYPGPCRAGRPCRGPSAGRAAYLGRVVVVVDDDVDVSDLSEVIWAICNPPPTRRRDFEIIRRAWRRTA